jgi:hypothetical protein
MGGLAVPLFSLFLFQQTDRESEGSPEAFSLEVFVSSPVGWVKGRSEDDPRGALVRRQDPGQGPTVWWPNPVVPLISERRLG